MMLLHMLAKMYLFGGGEFQVSGTPKPEQYIMTSFLFDIETFLPVENRI